MQKFVKATKLEGDEAIYFETLVFFNQAKSTEEKASYFDRLTRLNPNKENSSFRILVSQVELLSKWYVIAIRELIETKNFQDDAAWVVKQLKNKVTRKEVREAINTLFNLDFIERDPGTGKLRSKEAVLNYKESGAAFAVRNLHEQFLERALQSVREDSVKERNVTSSTLAIPQNKYPEVAEKIKNFINELSAELHADGAQNGTDSVVQLNTQLFFLTKLNSNEIKEG